MKNKGTIIVIIYFIVTTMILSLIPPEQQLGGWIRLIIFHGNLSVAALYVFYASGAVGLVAALMRRESLAKWSQELGLQSVFLWVVGTALSLVSMQVAWGGLIWNEPRTISALTIAFIAMGKEYLLRSNEASGTIYGVANAIFATAVLVLRSTLTFVMHPENPIGTSESMMIRVMPMVLLGLTLLTVFLLANTRLRNPQKA